MLIESSCIPKYRDLSIPGDDVLVVLPNRLYAVFDGATDTVGAMIQGETPGRFAANRAALAMVACANGLHHDEMPTSEWLARMNLSISTGLEQAGAQSLRAGTTAAVVVDAGDFFRFLIVGDTSVRINGSEVINLPKDIDLIYSTARIALFRHLLAKGMQGDEVEKTTRQLIFKGLNQPGQSAISAEDIASILRTARQECLPHLQPEAHDLIETSLLAGIAGGQYKFCNMADHSLGYAVINGGHTQGPDMMSFTRPKADIDSIELFTDGYFTCPQGTRLQDWEAEFQKVETEDFSKVDKYPGPKGSTSQMFSDDRTVLIAHFGKDGRP